MVMLDEGKYNQCNDSAQNQKLLSILSLSPKKLEKQENLDFVCRFLAHYSADISSKFDVDEFITYEVKELLISTIHLGELLEKCIATAEFLHEVSPDVLKRYGGGEFSGRVGKVGFECVFMGVAKNLDSILELDNPNDFMMGKIERFWSGDLANEVLGSGMNGNARISRTVPYGRNYFKPDS